MKPLRLEMTAFGPYGGSVEVDFERLADLGLFVVAGPTGSGKTSIFDALGYALYGALPGHRSSHGEVRSDYADPAEECQLTLVFEAGGERYRVWRLPAQIRAKKRGSGTREVPPEARLECLSNERVEPVSGKRDVDTRCAELVGLTAEQFQRVVLLPQGRFQEVLHASSDKRAELLRTLFGSKRYDDAAAVLAARARSMRAELESVEGRRGHELAAAARRLEGARDLLAPDEDVAPVDEGTASAADPATLGAEVERLRGGPLEALLKRRRTAEAEERARATELATAAAQAKALEQRRAALARRAELEGLRAERAADRERAERARAASPVVRALAVEESARARLGEAERATIRAWAEAREAIDLAGLTLAPEPDAEQAGAVAERLTEELPRLERFAADLETAAGRERVATELGEALEALTAEHRELETARGGRAGRRARLDPERERLRELADPKEIERRRASLAAAEQRATRRGELELVRERCAVLEAERAELEAARVAARGERDEHLAEAERLGVLAAKLPARDGKHAEHQTRRKQRELLAHLEHAHEAAVAAVNETRAAADQVFARFVAGTAPRLAATLRPSEPCPVCGSTEHPAPARPVEGESTARAEDVTRSSAEAASAASELRSAQDRIAQLLEQHPGLGDLVLEEIDQDIDRARQALDEARAAEEIVVRHRAGAEGAAGRLADLERRAEETTRALEAAAAERARLEGALGEEAALDADRLAAAVEQARVELEQATVAANALAELEEELAGLARDEEAATRREHELIAERSRAATERASAEGRARELRAAVTEALGEADPAALAARVREALAALSGARRAVTERDALAVRLREASEALASALEASPFAEGSAALAAALEPTSLADLEMRVESWRTELAKVEATLESLAAQDLPEEAPRLDDLTTARDAAAARATELRDRESSAETLLRETTNALAEVARIDAGSQAVRERAECLWRVEEVVAGRRAPRISLERWVLRAYLADVLDHANAHLLSMSRGRFRLGIEEEQGRGNAPVGLDLFVDDAWSGARRSTVSLSGGETFQASLALALGLADVVTGSRAGLRLDALFVDEGFGSLDAAAIDQAVEVLDGLKTRGAMVGVITHVEAMKEALPVALEVAPRADRRGSELRQLL